MTEKNLPRRTQASPCGRATKWPHGETGGTTGLLRHQGGRCCSPKRAFKHPFTPKMWTHSFDYIKTKSPNLHLCFLPSTQRPHNSHIEMKPRS